MSSKAYVELVRDVTNRTYTPNGSGSELFFKAMKRDQMNARIVKSGLIDDDFIMICAQTAFMDSGHPKLQIKDIDLKWATKNATDLSTLGAQVHQETVFRRFQDFYNDKLKYLYVNGTGTAHQAHHVGDLETKYEQLREELTRTNNNMEQLHENQDELESAYNVGLRAETGSRVPSAITTGGGTQITNASIAAMIAVAMAAQGTTPPGRPSHHPADRTVWKQWKYWCYSCGTNCSHDSRDHKMDRSKDKAHDQKLAATRTNPDGGNSTKDKYWMKWCHPVTYKAYDTPE